MKKYALIISFLFNVVFFALVVRHYILLPRKDTNPPLTYFANRNKVLQQLPKDTTDILFFGDTQFENFEVSELFNSLKVKNRGIFYDSSKGLLHRAIDVSSGKPAKIFIEVGINDLENDIPLQVIENNIQLLIDTIQTKSPKTKIYVQSVLPTNLLIGDDQHSIESQRLTLNTAYAKIAAKNNVVFVNLDPYFSDNGLKKQYDSGDHIHLNGIGYMKWRDILNTYISD